MAREFHGKIPRVPIDADTSKADAKIDRLFQRIDGLKHIDIDANVNQAQRRLETMVKRTNEQMSKELINTMTKDMRTVLGAMKAEYENLGDSSNIYKNLEKTCDMVEDRFSNLTISVDTKQISGLENILNNVAELQSIDGFSFDVDSSKQVAKNAEIALSKVKEAKKEIGSIVNKIDYIQKTLEKGASKSFSTKKLEQYQEKIHGLEKSLQGFYSIDDELIQNALVNAAAKINEVLGKIEIQMPKSKADTDVLSTGEVLKGLGAVEKKTKAIQEVASRISKNSSITGLKDLHQEAVDVTKALSKMYDEGMRDTERYITLQYKLQKIFDKLGKGYGGVRDSGAKNGSELLDFIIDGIEQRTGVNLFSSSGVSGIMENLFGDSDFSLFNKSLSGLGMKHIAELLLLTGKTGDWVDMQKQMTAEVEKTADAVEHVVEVSNTSNVASNMIKSYDELRAILRECEHLASQIVKHKVPNIISLVEGGMYKPINKNYLTDESLRVSLITDAWNEYKKLDGVVDSTNESLIKARNQVIALAVEYARSHKDLSALNNKELESFADDYSKRYDKAKRDEEVYWGRHGSKTKHNDDLLYKVNLLKNATLYDNQRVQIFPDSVHEKVNDLFNSIISDGTKATDVLNEVARLMGVEIPAATEKLAEANKKVDNSVVDTSVSKEQLEQKVKDLKYMVSNQEAWLKYLDGSLNKEKFKTSGKKEATEKLRSLTQWLVSNRRDNYEHYNGQFPEEMVNVAWMHGYEEAKRQGVAQSTLDRYRVPDAEYFYNQNIATLQEEYNRRQEVLNKSAEELRVIEAQIAAQEKLTTEVKNTTEARLKLTPKKDGSGEYTAMDGKYEIGQDAEGWKVFQRDNAGLWNLIGTYKHFEDIKNDVSLLTREEIVRTDEVINEIKTLQEAYRSLRTEMGGYMPLANKYIEVLDRVKSGAMSAADAIGQLNEVARGKGLTASIDNTAQEKMAETVKLIGDLQSKYGAEKFGEIFGDVGVIDVSNATEVYDSLIAKEQEYISTVQARMNALNEFTQVNGAIAMQHQESEPFMKKYAELTENILNGNIGLEEANKRLEEFTNTIFGAQQELSKMILGSSGETLAGTKPISFKYAVMSVEDLIMSHDAYGNVNSNYPEELQPRDRTRMVSRVQIEDIAKNIIPELLAASPTAQNGSPIVSNDGIVVGGNARSAALSKAYEAGRADGYKSYITEHASEFGLDPNNMPKNPVLVRVVDIDGGLDVLAKQLNESTTAGYSTTEQAFVNEELIMKVISKLNIDESANLNSEANRDFVQSFINLLSENQKNEMMTKDGSLSAVGLVKVKQALASAAYGSKEMLENLEQISPELLNISNALMAGAAKAANVRYAVESGELNDFGVVSTLLNGVELLKTARHNNQNIEEYMNQLSLFGSDYSAEDIAIGKFLEANIRNATQLKNMVDMILDSAKDAGDPNQISFDGMGATTLSDLVRSAFVKYAKEYQKDIDYDALISGYSPAEIGSRSDKRIDRTDVIDNTIEAKKEQIQLTEQAAAAAEEQAVAEEKVAEAANKAADTKERVSKAFGETKASSNISVEDIVERNISEALAQLRSAKDNETTLFTLKGVFEGEDLVEQAQTMIQKIADQANLSVAKFTVKDDIIQVKLYNDELKITVDQMYKLKAATEEMDSAQLQLVSQSFSQNVKALNENKFDVDGVQQRALAAVEKVRASLHGLEYDLTDLEGVAKNISSQDDFNKFNNQLKATQDNIQAIKNSTVSKSSMNPLANMQRDMQNASIEIETMRLKLEKFGDIQGVAEAKEMLTDMAAAAEQYNKATDAQGQQSAYNQYSNLRSSFKAQTEYINAAKALNDSQASEAKQVDPVREKYQSILDLVNKINAVNTNILKYQGKDGGSGMFAGYIEQLQAEKAKLTSELKGITDEINNTLGAGFVQGKEFSVPSASFLGGSGAISSFLNDIKTQASLTAEEIEKLIVALQKSQNIDVNAATKVVEQFKSVQETYKRLSDLTGLDQSNENYKALVNIFGQIMQYKHQLSSDSTSWTPEESAHLQTLIEQFTKYGNALADVGEKEARYFAGKQNYKQGTTFGGAIQSVSGEVKQANDIRKQLEDAAKAFAKDSGSGEAFITGFTQSADGISKLDFSVFDTATGSLRNFRMEMGSVTEGMYVAETTISKSLANIQAAQKQLQSVGGLLGRLDVSGVNISEDSAPAQVSKLLSLYKQLSAEISKGDGADQNIITKLTKDLKLASAETEKYYKQMIQMESAIANNEAQDLGVGDPKGKVYEQLVGAAQQLIGTSQNATLEFGRFDAKTNTLNASLVHANGTVENFQVSMNGLNGQMVAQQTGVGKLTSTWDRFKASVGKAGKQLVTAFAGYNVFYKAISEVRKGIGYVKEIDLALTELKKVTNETEESYRNFLNTAAGTAGKIGSTVSDFTEATSNFARLGYTMEESANMAETAIVYKNVADGLDTVDEATDSIISTMKAFGIESNDTMGIIDRFNEVGKYVCP